MALRHPLIVFTFLAYAISWLCWMPLVLWRNGMIEARPSQYLHLVGGLGPALAGLITAYLHGGIIELGDLKNRMVAWRLPLKWHAIAWISPFILFFMALAVGLLVSDTPWDPATFGRSPQYPGLPMPVYLFASILFFGWGEETGWRGFALGYLQQRRTALGATVLLSLNWAGWHAPLFAFSAGLGGLGPGEIVGWFVSLLTGAVLFTWITNSTRGSVLVAAIFHGTMDVAFVSPAPSVVMNTLGVLITIWGFGILLFAGPRYLSRSGKLAAAGAFIPRAGSEHAR